MQSYTILLILLVVIGTNAEMDLKAYNTDCTFNPRRLSNVTCSLKVVARNTVKFNVGYDLLLPMSNNTVHLTLYKFNNQFQPFLIDGWVNMCSNLSNANPLTMLLGSIIRQTFKSSKFNDCHQKVQILVRFMVII